MSDRTVMITLVHGTWAKDAPWTRRDSELSKRLASEGFTPERLDWDAGNRFSHRRDAAAKLRAHLLAHPDADHIVLGHSHGGSVALQALDGDDALVRGVVCLNTPFLNVLGRQVQLFERVIMMAGIAVGLIPFGLALRDGFGWWVLWTYLGLVVTVGLFAAGWSSLAQRMAARGRGLRAKPLVRTPVYCLSTPDDEPYGALAYVAALQNVLMLPLCQPVFLSRPLGALVMGLVLSGLLPVVRVPWEIVTGGGVRTWDFLASLDAVFQASGGLGELAALGGFLLSAFLSALYYYALLGLGIVLVALVVSGLVTWTQGQFRPILGLFNRFIVTLVPLHVVHTAFEEVETPPCDTIQHSQLYSDSDTIERIVAWVRAIDEGAEPATVVEAEDQRTRNSEPTRATTAV